MYAIVTAYKPKINSFRKNKQLYEIARYTCQQYWKIRNAVESVLWIELDYFIQYYTHKLLSAYIFSQPSSLTITYINNFTDNYRPKSSYKTVTTAIDHSYIISLLIVKRTEIPSHKCSALSYRCCQIFSPQLSLVNFAWLIYDSTGRDFVA